MVFEPGCSAAPLLGHSWGPTLHWWLSLTASDQGAWISGLGAFAAAAAALWVSSKDRRERLRERRALGAVAGEYLYPDVQKMVALTGALQHLLRSTADVKPGFGYMDRVQQCDLCTTQLRQIVERAGLERMAMLPVGVARELARTFGSFPIVLDSIQSMTNLLRLGQPLDTYRTQLRDQAEMVKPIVAGLRLFFVWYGKQNQIGQVAITVPALPMLHKVMNEGMTLDELGGFS